MSLARPWPWCQEYCAWRGFQTWVRTRVPWRTHSQPQHWSRTTVRVDIRPQLLHNFVQLIIERYWLLLITLLRQRRIVPHRLGSRHITKVESPWRGHSRSPDIEMIGHSVTGKQRGLVKAVHIKIVKAWLFQINSDAGEHVEVLSLLWVDKFRDLELFFADSLDHGLMWALGEVDEAAAFFWSSLLDFVFLGIDMLFDFLRDFEVDKKSVMVLGRR